MKIEPRRPFVCHRMAALALIVLWGSSLAGCGSEQIPEPGLRIYVLEGGVLEVADMSPFDSEGRYDGETLRLVNPSYLIRHPEGDLLWDTGYSDSLADTPGGIRNGPWHWQSETRITEQLARLNLVPADIEYLSLSHLHPDHSGNANLFTGSTFLVSAAEREHMFDPEIRSLYGDGYSELESARTLVFEHEHDVFGDGSAVIYWMPGHTPGSTVLLLRTAQSGSLLLSGDLFTHARARELGTVPTFNADPGLTSESRQQFESLAAREGARILIQHNPADFESLPKFPDFLE